MYNLELDELIERINKKNHKNILIQLPDGLKPKAKFIADEIRDKTKAEVIIWFGSCFGACDIPRGLNSFKFDLLVQWGHNKFVRVEGW